MKFFRVANATSKTVVTALPIHFQNADSLGSVSISLEVEESVG